MKTLTTVQKAFLALIIANTIWGAASPIFKLALENIPVFTLAFWRFFLGSILLLIVIGKRAGINLQSKKDAVYLLLSALFGITINIIFFFEGLKLTYAMNGPVIASSQPIMVLFVALLFLHERFNLKKFVGMILGTVGIFVIILEPLLVSGVGGSITGNFFILIATLGAVGQIITAKKILDRYNPWSYTFWTFVIGAASFLPLAIYDYVKIPQLYVSLDWRGYMGVVYGVIFSSTIGYGLFAWGLSKIQASDSAIFSYLDPIVGTALAAVMLGEPITPPFLLGAMFIFGGIFLAEGRIHYHPFKKLFLLGKTGVPVAIPDKSPQKQHHSSTEKKKILTEIFEKS